MWIGLQSLSYFHFSVLYRFRAPDITCLSFCWVFLHLQNHGNRFSILRNLLLAPLTRNLRILSIQGLMFEPVLVPSLSHFPCPTLPYILPSFLPPFHPRTFFPYPSVRFILIWFSVPWCCFFPHLSGVRLSKPIPLSTKSGLINIWTIHSTVFAPIIIIRLGIVGSTWVLTLIFNGINLLARISGKREEKECRTSPKSQGNVASVLMCLSVSETIIFHGINALARILSKSPEILSLIIAAPRFLELHFVRSACTTSKSRGPPWLWWNSSWGNVLSQNLPKVERHRALLSFERQLNFGPILSREIHPCLLIRYEEFSETSTW